MLRKMIMYSLRTGVVETIRKYRMIQPGEKIAVAVSGGPDSMALLYLLHDLRQELECALYVAHLDHMLRGEESEADAEYVKEHAEKLDLPITVEAVNVKKMITSKESLESGARRIRYEFYERVMADAGADKVAQGHNSDDQAETIIMRLLRGSGAHGLGGIPSVRGSFIRPLIETSRSEIDRYLRLLQVTPRHDSSNLHTIYRRNKIRLELLPLLEHEYSPNIKHILRQTGELLRTEDDLLTALAEEATAQCVQYPDARTAIIRISDLDGHHLALQRRILRLVIKTLVGDLGGFDYDHIRDILELAHSGATGSIINVPRGLSAEKVYNNLILRHGYQPKIATVPFDYRISIPGETAIPELSLLIRATGPEEVCGEYRKPQMKDESQATLDYDRIRGDLHLRNRRSGDRFRPLGMSGTKKLKDFFIDQKIPRDLRDRVPLLTNGNDILWVVGYRLDDRFKITANTRNQIAVTSENC